MLVARPGVGKSNIIGPVSALWKSCPLLHVGAQTLTNASFIDSLIAAEKERNLGGQTYKTAPLLLASSEFGSLTPTYDQSLLTRIADVYDGRPDFESSTRADGLLHVTAPLVHILVGITPKFLGSIIPDTAWQQGFMSRFHVIYSDERTRLTHEQMFHPEKIIIEKEKLAAAITRQLVKLCHYHGQLTWEAGAAEELFHWNEAGMPPAPTHPKLETYCTRRLVHVCKLCIIICAASNRHVISQNDLHVARLLLLESESTLAETFHAMSQTPESEQIEQIYHWLILQAAVNPGGVSISAFHNYLGNIVGVPMIERMYNHLELSDVIRVRGDKVLPGERQNG